MLEEGYAAVTMRRVAKEAGLSSALLHYYYPTLDDLLVAFYRHTAARDLVLLENALAQPEPLASLWSYQTDSSRTALGVEFLALANHKKVVRAEIAQFVTQTRHIQADRLAKVFPRTDEADRGASPICLATLLTSISRSLIMEGGVGISLGHAETRALVEGALASGVYPLSR